MKIVLDTNVLLTSISERSSIHLIFSAFLNESYTLCVTTDILTEYEEVIGRHLGKKTADSVMEAIENANNVEWVTKFFYWKLIQADPDDDKFVDCAIAIGAKFIVTEDKHFQVITEIPFPKVEIINARNFVKQLQNRKPM